MSVSIRYRSTPAGNTALLRALLTFNLKQPNNYRKYLVGSTPQSDSEALYSDWAKVGNGLKQAAKHISN